MNIKYFKQETDYSCGAAAFRMVLNSLGIDKTEEELVKILNTSSDHGTWFKDFVKASKQLNLNIITGSNSSITELKTLMSQGYRIIVCYFVLKQGCDHYSVIHKINGRNIYFLDPWLGRNHKYSLQHFRKIWRSRKRPDQAEKWFIAIKL